MQHKQALSRLRDLFRRNDPESGADVFSGPTLLQQEPDLMQETARYNVSSSAWAAGGHPFD